MTKEYFVDSGQTLHDPLDPFQPGFAYLPLGVIVASRTNPRTVFDAAKLQELAESIKASGVLQPILVRPLPGSRVADTAREVQYEIIAGERRFRACVLAGLATIPALFRSLTDSEVFEAQLVENLQRQDLTELEEAQGYEGLMQHSSLSAEAVGAKIGKSRSYVYERLRLLELAPECKAALQAGGIDFSRALKLARIPDHKLQLKALDYATTTDGNGEVCSVRALQTWLRQNVMLPLEHALFNIADPRLVEAAGSCKTCPKRTGAAPDIFSDVTGADICTDPPCYNDKSNVHALRLEAKAVAKGMRLVSGSEARTICYPKSSTLNGYSPLSQVREDAGGQRLDELLGKAPEGAVLIENPWTRELIEAVPTEEAESRLIAQGLVQAVVEPAVKADALAAQLRSEIDHIKSTTERGIENQFRADAHAALVSAVRICNDTQVLALLSPALLRAWLLRFTDDLERELVADMLHINNVTGSLYDAEFDIAAGLRLQACSHADLYRALAIYIIDEDKPAGGFRLNSEPMTLFAALAPEVGVHLGTLRETTTASYKRITADKIRDLKAQLKPAKTPPPTTPLAQPPVLPGAGADASRDQARPRLKPKLSATQAQSGIADAMQGMEEVAEPVPGPAVSVVVMPATIAEFRQQMNSLAGFGFVIGQRVTVLPCVTGPRGKWIGKQGTVCVTLTDNAIGVTFRGRLGGLCDFDASELSAVPS